MIDALVKSRFKHVKAFLWCGVSIGRPDQAYRLRDEFLVRPSGQTMWLEVYGGSLWLYREKKQVLERQRLALRNEARR